VLDVGVKKTPMLHERCVFVVREKVLDTNGVGPRSMVAMKKKDDQCYVCLNQKEMELKES
jgi:hypothetical protein